MISRRTILALTLALPAARASATSTTPDDGGGPDLAALKKAAATYPQPVRVGDLPKRYLLAPLEAQTVLGHIADPAVLKQGDGSLVMAIDRGGFLGIGTTRVLVPIADVALSGYYVILVGLTQDALDALPSASGGSDKALAADTVIPMGIVGPFH
jgi:hypothetical protein